MSWTTSEAIAEQVLRRWNRGDILAAHITGDALFPFEIRLKRPGPRDVANRFGEVQDWARALSAASRESRGFGFELRHETRRNRVQGQNELPVAAILPSQSDALRLIRRQTEAARFETLAETTLTRYPGLRDWLARRALAALKHADAWQRILAVLDWFVANPNAGLYLRQLDIPGVDTKFIEAHRGLLTELLDIVLPDDAVDRSASGIKRFQQRFGLQSEAPLLRFRLLDRELYLHGLSDLSVLPVEFARLELPVRRLFITENRTNGLAFPDHPESMVVFGLGYGLDRLVETPWLHDLDIHYWGDIDTHGFRILDRLRATLPEARSFLMDRAALDAHKPLWGREPLDTRYTGALSRLTESEAALFDDLRRDRIGEQVRLEQERIAFGCLQRTLAGLS